MQSVEKTHFPSLPWTFSSSWLSAFFLLFPSLSFFVFRWQVPTRWSKLHKNLNKNASSRKVHERELETKMVWPLVCCSIYPHGIFILVASLSSLYPLCIFILNVSLSSVVFVFVFVLPYNALDLDFCRGTNKQTKLLQEVLADLKIMTVTCQNM